ncbi:DUF4037 domain-containing protein [Halobacillus sp. Marseille-P3879]|uniref:DUF4037 domain-containing protein n=1 Tax=Halobacillus sp. Marseille-P3879 TaxID=2045014 RepID=UPI000C7A3C92|nr:DUF4037 domain-containing protein [Halobacillus sp. Marseille-P3879]
MNLKDLAVKAANVYKENSKVEAVYIAGSLSRGWEDQYSDIELNVCWYEAPNEADRKSVIDALSGEIIEFHDYEEEEWSESYKVNDIKLEISSFLTEGVLRKIQRVTKEFQVNIKDQCLAASIHYGIPLHGEEVLDGLKAKVVVYPESLSQNMIEAHLDLGEKWQNRYALLEREDWLMYYSLLTMAQKKIMGLLFGLNCLYVHHPSYKWQKQSLDLMNIKPERVNERLDRVFLSSPDEGLKEVEALMEEIKQLIKEKDTTI